MNVVRTLVEYNLKYHFKSLEIAKAIKKRKQICLKQNGSSNLEWTGFNVLGESNI